MKAIEATLIVGVIVAVGAFGGTEPLSFGLVEVGFFAVAAWLLLRPGAVKAAIPALYFAVPAALVVLALVQVCPLPVGFVSRVSGQIGYSGAQVSHLSIAPYNSRSEFLILLTCCAAFFLSCIVNQDRGRKQRLIYVVVALGAAEAFYGLAQYLMNVQSIFWYTKKYDLEEATGTYINRNHFAGFLEMVLPFAVCLTIYEAEKLLGRRKHRHSSPVSKAARRAQKLAGDDKAYAMILWLVLSVVMMAAIIFSRSRMGMLAAAFSILVVFALKLLRRRRKAVPAALAGVFVALSVGLAVWIGVQPALTRFESLGQEFSGDESRLSMWPGSLKLIAAHPIAGTGLGTFPVAYTQVQTTFLTKFVNHAHNDYLEVASDLGIPAAILLFGSIVIVLSRALRNFLHGEGNYGPAVSLTCVGSLVAILLHSFTDFNLHIPGNALLFAVILGLSLASNSQTTPGEAGS